MVCRAGAITVSELCAAGVPAVLVPLVVSTTAHQRDNAQWLAAQGGAVHLPQPEGRGGQPKRLTQGRAIRQHVLRRVATGAAMAAEVQGVERRRRSAQTKAPRRATAHAGRRRPVGKLEERRRHVHQRRAMPTIAIT
jgi:UDP-N-acetylglucosamine--N-acetylmuramyl-(pentapeptide) pyrophosphoryl-undecaprenol N-acetylglucosamine transferase